MKGKKLKVGIVGFGVVGQRRKLFIDKNSNLETVAVCDVRFKKDGSMIDGADFNYTYDLLEDQSYAEPLSGEINDEIQFFNTQYQRGIIAGVNEIEKDDILDELEINTNEQQKGLHIDKDLHEEMKAIDDFHLHVRNKLDKTAQLN